MSFASRTLCVLALLVTTGVAFKSAEAGRVGGEGQAERADAELWKDRSTPRKMLETFFYAIVCYDLAPELIVNAIDCLELGDMSPTTRERDAALMAHELSGIISNRSDISLYGVPEKVAGSQFVLVDEGGIRIVMTRQPDGTWRFARETVDHISRMRARMGAIRREEQEARAKMAEGRTDPQTTLRTFIHAALIKRDFSAAARCLDLRDVPPKLRATRGPEMARKLMFVIQRCGFAFPQEFPSDPTGWRFIWHSNHRGRVMLDRVSTAEGKDAWLFSRMTLKNLDALVEGFKPIAPDPRYARVGMVVDASILTNSQGKVPAPKGVPAALGSPRATLRTFFQAWDALEFDDHQAETVLACLDLTAISAADRSAIGLRLAGKLQAILRSMNIDLLGLSESWEAETLKLNPQSDDSLTLARQADGVWRFDQESIAIIPELFSQLSLEQKIALERRTPFHSARQTMRTLLTAMSRDNARLAAECLDLSKISIGARRELGPLLAYKLKFVLDHLGRVVVQEIPNESEGPCYFVYRGSIGRIELARGQAEDRQNDWLFTNETVNQIDSMFQSMLNQSLMGSAGAGGLGVQDLSPRSMPGLWIRSRMPIGLRLPMLGLSGYQWIGLVIIGFTSLALGWVFLKGSKELLGRSLQHAHFNLSCEFVNGKLRPLAFQVVLWVLYFQLPLLDLPIRLVGLALPTVKFLWVGLLAWTILRLIDLGMAIYTNSEHLNVRNNLNDMIVPTATRVFKLVVLVSALGYQVYLLGSGEWLTKLLAGLGLVGLAASLAAQDTLKNFFGTLLLIGEHPFKMGDVIVVNGHEGTVEAVGFRSTRIRTPEDSLMTIPNSVIAGTSIDNRGVRKTRRYRCLISMSYDTPVERMTSFRDALRAAATDRPEVVRADKVNINIFNLADSSIELLINVYFWASTYTEELEARDWLNREILRQAELFGVEIAYPTQTIQMCPPAAPERVHSGHEAIPAPKLAQAGRRQSESEEALTRTLRHDL